MGRLLGLTAPLFFLVLLGYALARWGKWPKAVSDALTQFAFTAAVPALLFQLMSGVSRLPPVDARVLIAFFGSCLLVFMLGRFIASRVFRMDGVSQSVFALGGIFSNNVLLGVPLAKIVLGEASVPVVSLVLVFNSLLLWTLATVSVEWARHRSLSWSAYVQAAKTVITNPVVASIFAGTLWGLTGLALPGMIDQTLTLVGQAAIPLSLIALGMGLAEYRISEGWRESTTICALKLGVQPIIVWLLARALTLPALETQAICHARLAAGWCQRLSHVTPVQDEGRGHRGEPGTVDSARRGNHAVAAGTGNGAVDLTTPGPDRTMGQ